MHITVKWFDGKYPTFNLILSTKEGKEPFLEVKGCRIVSGKVGEFVSGPSTKGSNDKYWNHTYMSKDFSAVVLEKAKEAQPKQSDQKQSKSSGSDDFESDIPF